METLKHIPIGARRSVRPDEIVLLVADVNYTMILLSNGAKLLVATTLKELEKRFMNCESFFRVHKSYLLNLSYIRDYNLNSDEGYVQMKYDYKAVVSRRKKSAFKKRLALIACE